MGIYFRISLPQGLSYTKTPNTATLTSRGCSANCIFCATARFWGNKYRARSPENVIAEIDELVKKYGIKEIQFIDDNLTLNKKRAIAIFRSIKKRFKIAWSTPQGIAPWALDEELIKEMKDSGCYEISLAVESGDQDILKQVIRKPGSLDKIKRLVKEINRVKMLSKGFFVIGLPGETKEQIQKTFKFALDLKLDSATFSLATPFPGTRLYSLCLEKGYLKKGFDFNRTDFSVGSIKTPDFTPDELERLTNRKMAIFNTKLFLRNPPKFIKKYSLLLFHNPRMMIKYVLGLFDH
jgi:phosphonoacetaldehyde methylase